MRPAFAIAALVAAISCGGERRPGAPSAPALPVRSATAAATRAAGSGFPGALEGWWIVVADSVPRFAALDEHQVRRRMGWKAYFGRDSVVYHHDRCTSPAFTEQVVPGDSFFSAGFWSTPEQAGVRPDARGRVRITNVTCSGGAWNSPAQQVFWSGRDTVAVDDQGVFLLLRRQR